MIFLHTVLAYFILVAVPKTFEFPLFVIGKQTRNGLEYALIQPLRMIFAKYHQSNGIDQIWVIESLKQNRQHK